MASSGFKRERKDDSSKKSSTLEASLLFTGGALIGAALLYGAKRLYDYWSDIKKTSDTPKENLKVFDDWSTDRKPQRSTLSDFSASISNGYETAVQNPHTVDLVSPGSDGAASVVSVGSLHDCLLNYYTSYVDIPHDDLSLAKTVVEDVKDSFVAIIEALLPNHPIVAIVDVGPAAEGWKVIRPDEFEVVIHLSLDPQVWELIDGGQTLLAAHGHWMVKRTHLEFFSRGTKPYDRYLIGEYLSPAKVKTAFLDMSNRVSNWNTSYVIKSSVVGPAVKLTVEYGTEEQKKKLTIDFMPGVKLGGIEIISPSNPKASLDHCYENLWLQSFGQQEVETLTARPTPHPPKELEAQAGNCLEETLVKQSEIENVISHLTDSVEGIVAKVQEVDNSGNLAPEVYTSGELETGCQVMCLKILEAVRLNHPAELGILTPYALKTVILHLLYAEDSWCQAQLSERFLDTLKALEDYFKMGRLPHFFCPHINLLENASPGTLENGREFLAYVIGNNRFPSLLRTIY